MTNNQLSTLFNIISLLGNNKNFKNHKDNYLNKLSFIKTYNNILILRIKKLSKLLQSKNFSIFFFDYVKKYHIGLKVNFKNNLKNNFKLFIYTLYKSNIILLKFIKTFNSVDSLTSSKNISNLYFPYINDNFNLSPSFLYNFLYKDSFKLTNFSTLNKFSNFSYLRSNKKKRFKQKESEKLSLLRENLNRIEENPFRLKFYYRYFEYKRLHSYWNKEAFLQKKFKYFNPQINNNNIVLLHFFFKFRKFRSFSNKYDVFRKKLFINFWLQTKIKKFQFSSYKIKKKNKKTSVKFLNYYLDNLINYDHINNKINKSLSSLLLKYKKNNFIYNINFLKYPEKIESKKNLKVINKTTFLKFLYSYINLRTTKLDKNFHLLSSFYKNSTTNRTIFLKKKKNLNLQLINFNINKTTKYYIFDALKKNKTFRIKFKYIKWLNQQKELKRWKYNKYLSFKKVSCKTFKNNLNTFNFKSNGIKNIENNLNSIIYKAKLNSYNWLKYNYHIYNLSKVFKLSNIINNLNKSSENYLKNFSFYKSNKILDQKYTYLNLFKNKKLNTGIFKNKSKNNFILQKISKNLFKLSWHFTYKQFPKVKKYKGFYNLVPIYNYFFINKVIKLYKKLLISKLVSSYGNLFGVYLNKNYFYKLGIKNNYMAPIKLNLLNRINSIRNIDKKYSFKKRKERQLLYSLKNYKNTQSLLISRFKKNKKLNVNVLNNNFSPKDRLNVLNLQKIIKKLKFSLNILPTFNFKQKYLFNNSIKLKFFKKNSFLNFFKYYNKQSNNISDNYFNTSFFSSFNILNYNSSIKKKNINKLRLRFFKSNSKLLLSFFNKKNKKNLFILNKIFINNFKKINYMKSNLGLNFLLKKNYFIFLRLFKFFSLYKRMNMNNNLLGFGRLSNYLNINNENIFSIFNFYMYNFYNFNKENLYKNKDFNIHYVTTYQNLNYYIKNTLFLSKDLELNSSNVINYNYDIINKANTISNIIYSKHYLIKYLSLLNINNLIKFKRSKLIKNILNIKIDTKNVLINFHFQQYTYSYYNIENPIKKLYYNILDNYKNILFF